VAVIPQGNSQGIDFLASKTGPQRNAPKDFKLALKMEGPEGEIKQKFTLYIGPMDSKNLSELNVGLEETMNWGWIVVKPFSIGTLWLFKLLHQFIPNYGLVIIVFAVIVKIVLWPLTHKSYESMKKMQELQPYLKEIREKYKGDAAKMQKATAELYKEHKVNPLGGCLPVLLQMPLLIALFNVFRSTIELRGQPFCLWIKDLSLPDTVIKLNFTIPMYGNQVSVLPILMGVSTFFQSKTSMTDPNQKMMLYFMPIFLLLMFNNFPSGLTLYYTLFNIFSMVQQKMAHGEIRILSSSATKSARQKSLK
jgi:YidC/Oxa1 family membrane protein insertase